MRIQSITPSGLVRFLLVVIALAGLAERYFAGEGHAGQYEHDDTHTKNVSEKPADK